MPVIKAITATNVINAFSGTPDGTKFLRDDGTLAAVSGYTKLVASGVNDGTLTLYDDTATTGVTTLVVRAGVAGDGWPTQLLDFRNNAGTSLGGVAINSGPSISMWADDFRSDSGGTAFLINGSAYDSMYMRNTFSLKWSAGYASSAGDIGLARASAGILKVTNGFTGQGGIGIADSATNTVSDALILRHATSGTAAASFGTGLLFQGEDASGNMQDMARISAVYTDATNGSEDANLVASVISGGAVSTLFTFTRSGTTTVPAIAGSTDIAIEAGGHLHLNAASLLFLYAGSTARWQIDSSALSPYATNTYDIGTSSAVVRAVYTAGINVYDATATTGASYITIREGDAQAGAGPYPISVYQNDGTTLDFAVAPEFNTGWTGVRDLRYIGNSDAYFRLDPTGGLTFRNAGSGGNYDQGINWNDTTYDAVDLRLVRYSASVVRVANGTTGAGAILASRYVQAKTADYSVTPAESNSAFTNEGTTAKHNFTLPTAVANLVYTFVVQDSDGLTVTANTGDTIQDSVTVSASAGNIDSTDVGAAVTLLAINATQWIVTSMTGTWVIT